jgi:hypothetical protein
MKRFILPLLFIVVATPAHAQFSFEKQPQNQKARPAPPQNEGAVSALVGASQQAAIYRVRSMAGGQQYRPEITCQRGDVNIGTNSSQPTSVGNLTVVTGSACPAYMRKGQ